MVPLLARRAKAAATPVSRVAVTACHSYGAGLVPALDGLFDRLDIGRLVNGKTVAIKINMTGSPNARVGYVPLEDTVYSHPRVIGAVAATLLPEAGSRILEVGCGGGNVLPTLAAVQPDEILRPLMIPSAGSRRSRGMNTANARIHQRLDRRVGMRGAARIVRIVDDAGDAGVDAAQRSEQIADIMILRPVMDREREMRRIHVVRQGRRVGQLARHRPAAR